jgi:hypothetical protein
MVTETEPVTDLERVGAGSPTPAARAKSVVEWIARRPRRAFLVLFLLAFGAGLANLPFVRRAAIAPHVSRETEAIAAALATRGAFADPYALPTGPTAHMPPVTPALLALIYRLFGFTMTAGYVFWLLRVGATATMLAMLPWLGRRLGVGAEPGVVAGVVGSLTLRWPYQIEYFAGIAMALLVAWHLRGWTRGAPRTAGALLLGLAWGAAFHLLPSLLPVMLGCLAFGLWWDGRKSSWRAAAAVLLGAAVACVPWGLRNYRMFGEVFLVRSNFGLELRLANREGAVADVEPMVRAEGDQIPHPRINLEQARLMQRIGEMEYMRRARREAFVWIRAHPGRFLLLTARRTFHFWFGAPSDWWMAAGASVLTILAALGLRRAWPVLDPPRRAALLVPLVSFPVVYYVVVFMPRYSAPLTWLLLLLAAVELWHWAGGRLPRPGPAVG